MPILAFPFVLKDRLAPHSIADGALFLDRREVDQAPLPPSMNLLTGSMKEGEAADWPIDSRISNSYGRLPCVYKRIGMKLLNISHTN